MENKVIGAIVSVTGVTEAQLKQKRGKRHIVDAKCISQFIMYYKEIMTQKQIAEIFGVDHSSIVYNISKAETLINIDASMGRTFIAVMKLLGQDVLMPIVYDNVFPSRSYRKLNAVTYIINKKNNRTRSEATYKRKRIAKSNQVVWLCNALPDYSITKISGMFRIDPKTARANSEYALIARL